MSLFQPPPRTRLDLNFTFFGVPVRVHPLFWLLTLLLGASSGSIVLVLIWIVVVFVSILIHEFGHSLMMRAYGQESYIVLHFAGGLAVPTSARGGSRGYNDSTQRILISLAGPFAGFLLAGIVLAIAAAMGGSIVIQWILFIIPLPRVFLPDGGLINAVFSMLLWVNIFWGLINLVPIFPLDGGQVARELFVNADPWGGTRKSLWLSVISGGVLVVVCLVFLNSIFMALLFGLLALQSYQMLQGF